LGVPHEFAENEFELGSQASSARGGGPPRKLTGIGVLDPPVSPKRPPGPIPVLPSSLFFRVLSGVLLIGMAVTLFLLLFAKH